MLQTTSLKFLKDLKKNNQREWFEKNRSTYETAKADFTTFIQTIIDQHGKNDPTIKNIVAKDCLFRINRDVRFSKDKSPYKTNFGASINKGGRKAWENAGYYFHFEPGRSFAGGGIWMPETPQLKKIRQEIDYNFNDFKKIMNARKFKSVYGDLVKNSEYQLTRIPKGYEAENPAADYLRLKSFVAMVPITDSELQNKTALKKTLEAFEALLPLLEFINHID